MEKTILLLVLSSISVFSQNPCPNIFEYKNDGQGNYGIITIPGPGQGRTVLNVQIAIRGPIFNSRSGGLKLRKPLRDTVNDARRGQDIQYILNFPDSQEIPYITMISLNYNSICPNTPVYNLPSWSYQHEFTYPSGLTQLSDVRISDNFKPIVTPPTTPSTTTTFTPIIPDYPIIGDDLPVSRPSDGSWLKNLPYSAQCGRRPEENEATQLIIGGSEVKEGEFPWMVALFHLTGRPVYKCGASLISNTYIITAAHCTKDQEKVYLELGKHNIATPDERGYESRVSLAIIKNPEYKSDAHGDVALILIQRVEFTPKIRPICLWAQGTRLDNLIQNGTITGWGRLENDGSFSQVPLKLSVRTVGLDECRRSNNNLRNIATDKTFCAGGKSTGPCHGDSGSGFYIRHGKVWYLRGIISTSLGTNFACNVNEFAVYVDLAYYLDWIRPFLT